MFKVEIGGIYDSRFCGKFKVLDSCRINNRLYYKIEFIKTKYNTVARSDVISTGNVNDPYFPKIYGVACFGEPKIDGLSKGLVSSIYNRWSCMISRCYNKNDNAYYAYGAIGIRVCERWLCFENYLNDVQYLPGFDDMINNPHIKFNLDKDIKQSNVEHGKRIYSPETCIFVPAYANSVQVAIDHLDEHSNNYHNVIYHKSKYNVQIQINNETIRIGRYNDEIVAANAANHARRLLGLDILNKDVPYIPLKEVISQNIREPLIFAKVINN